MILRIDEQRPAASVGPEDRSDAAGRSGVLSIDVFDTTLTRSCGPPEALYLWLGYRLHSSGIVRQTPESFARARMRAERDVWTRAGGMDARVFLEDFYREVVRTLMLDPGLVPRLVQEELRLESEVLHPVPSALDVIEDARRSGKGVVFVTDTYFPGSFVEGRLAAAGALAPGERCFASSELARSKASGLLFDTVVEATGGRAGEILHVGDNLHSDIHVPRRKGLRTRMLAEGRLTRHERLLAQHMWGTAGVAASFAGAARRARMHVGARDDHERAIRDVAAGVAAPMLVSYVLWVLHRAADLGLDRLFFLSRDGQIFADIAGRLVARLGMPTQVSYLHVSRLSTNLAATLEVDDEELSWIFRDREFLSPAGLLERLDISWSEAAGEMEHLGIAPDGAPTSPPAAEAIRQALRGPLRGLVLERAAARRALVQAYLRQEGVLAGGRCGIVDFGGMGSQMRALHTLVGDAGARAPRIFLVGVDKPPGAEPVAPADEPAWLRDTECYLYDHRRGLGIKRFRGFGTLVQMFCAADHDTVTGYRREGERVVPTFASGTADLLERWGLPVMQATIRHVADHVRLDADLVDQRADLREAICAVVAGLWSEPTVAEARAWGSFPFEGAQADSAPHPLAAAYSWPSTVAGVLRRTFPDLGWQHWHEASLRLSPPVLRRAVGTAESLYWGLDRNAHPLARRLAQAFRRALDR